MRRAAAAAASLALLLAVPVSAAEIITSIDLDYTYEQRHEAEDVEATTTYRQKYEVRSEGTFSSGYDFIGAARLELEDAWRTDEAGTARAAPTLEFEMKSEESALKLTYQAVVSTTEPFEETDEIETYSTNLEGTLEVIPVVWPEVKLKLQRKRDLEPERSDATTRTVELTVRKPLSALVLEYYLKREWVENTLPERGLLDSADWKGKATYKEVLWSGIQLELSYEIEETYERETERDVFVSDTDTADQQLRSRIQKTIALTPRLSLKLGWEYLYDEDLLGLEYDVKTTNKYQAQLRYDPLSWAKLLADVRREHKEDRFPLPKDDEESLTDSLTLSGDVEPFSSLRLTGKAEFKSEDEVRDGSGGSLDRRREENYETVLRHRIGTWWELTLNGATKRKHEEGWLTSREAKGKAELSLKPLRDVTIAPRFETVRETEWEVRNPDPESQRRTQEWKIKFDARRKLADLLQVVFVHEYGVKTEEELDNVLNFERTVELNESTRLTVAIAELIAGLKIEGEIDRDAEDQQDDGDPMIVDVSYALKVDYSREPLIFSSSLKYNDKGDAFDDLSVNAKLEWRSGLLTLTGEYQYDKVYADVTDETRKLNLKLAYKF